MPNVGRNLHNGDIRACARVIADHAKMNIIAETELISSVRSAAASAERRRGGLCTCRTDFVRVGSGVPAKATAAVGLYLH